MVSSSILLYCLSAGAQSAFNLWRYRYPCTGLFNSSPDIWTTCHRRNFHGNFWVGDQYFGSLWVWLHNRSSKKCNL